MKPKKKVIQTGLNIAVKPISDQGMTEEEYRAKVAEIKKQHESCRATPCATKATRTSATPTATKASTTKGGTTRTTSEGSIAP